MQIPHRESRIGGAHLSPEWRERILVCGLVGLVALLVLVYLGVFLLLAGKCGITVALLAASVTIFTATVACYRKIFSSPIPRAGLEVEESVFGMTMVLFGIVAWLILGKFLAASARKTTTSQVLPPWASFKK